LIAYIFSSIFDNQSRHTTCWPAEIDKLPFWPEFAIFHCFDQLEDTGFSRIWNFFQFGDSEEIFLSGT
jgi:hypothetical protein